MAATGKPGFFFRRHPAFKLIFRFLLAWGFLNVFLNLSCPAAEYHLLSPLRISPEILFLTAGLCATARLRVPLHWSIYLALTLLVLFFRFFRIADALVPMYLFRPFNLYIDSQFLPVLIHLLCKTLPLKTFIFGSLFTLLLLALSGAGIWWSLKTIHQFFADLKNGGALSGLIIAAPALLLLVSVAAGHNRPRVFHEGAYRRILEEVDFMLHLNDYRDRQAQIIKRTARQLEQIPRLLDRLAGNDVYLIFIESYGQTIFADRRHFQIVEPVLTQYERDLAAGGFFVNSGFLKSPAFGGSSWLAHATIASGVELPSQLVYDLLITSDAKTMAHHFNRAGYRTINVMPANEWPWPEGTFFGYQKHYFAWDFEYRGPRFGWAPMSDQYVLQYIYRKEIAPRTQPLFVEFVLISSHAPFNRQPPYLEDWSQIGDGSIYHHRKPISFPVAWPDLTNAAEAYAASIVYEISVLKNFIERYVRDDTLIIIMGDHQPNAQITGAHSSWSVPVHVISRNKDFTDPFKKKGYTSGLIPRQPPPHPGMETFLYDFLKSFSSSSGGK